jgi:hypothetical protein
MDSIIEPNAAFDFSKITLAHPVGIQGGAYFTKIEYNNKPLYIQTVKSQTRQGFVKTGKKYYCDLMFDNNADKLIHWFENLEEKCQKLIFEKRDTWFQNNLEESDIESAFNSTIRVYKSGKYYLIRTNVKNNHNNSPAVKIYNENEISMGIQDVTCETNMISILEIQGIKFTSRNFQIEIELKQVMVLDNEILFENCLIKTKKPPVNAQEALQENIETLEDINLDQINEFNNDLNVTSLDKIDDFENKIIIDNDINDINDTNISDNNDTNINNIDINDNNNTNISDNNDTNINNTNINDNNNTDVYNSDNLEEISEPPFESLEDLTPVDSLEPLQKSDNISLEIEDLNLDTEENSEEIKPVKNMDVSLENNLETIKLKKPNQVYFELYKEARNKAKIAKRNALLAYLEAKNIKKTYMLDNLDDSDSDIDAEIDEVSESELEDL